MYPIIRSALKVSGLLGGLTACLLACNPAIATEAGLMQFKAPGASAGDAPVPVALFYPTQAPPRTIPMGPFTAQVAIQAPPDDRVKGLILLSHGIGGSELGHVSLAQALARSGYLVAAIRHPGDNYADNSLLRDGGGRRYFSERPRQASRVIDALLADPQWKDRIASDASGPKVGALGHSAGGYTVLAMAGGQPQVSRITDHCAANAALDPVFCGVSSAKTPAGGALPTLAAVTPASATPDAPESLVDPRVRAVVALAPTGVVLTAASLQAIRLPVAVYEAEQDRYLVPRFHAEWVASNLPGVEMHRVPNALHFVFMDTPAMPIMTADGDVRTDLPGFDRPALLQQLGREIPAFFDRALR
jgi:predicted dienelactone hydrolase